MATAVCEDFDESFPDASAVEAGFSFCGEGAEGSGEGGVVEELAGVWGADAFGGGGVGFEEFREVGGCANEAGFAAFPLGAR